MKIQDPFFCVCHSPASKSFQPNVQARKAGKKFFHITQCWGKKDKAGTLFFNIGIPPILASFERGGHENPRMDAFLHQFT